MVCEVAVNTCYDGNDGGGDDDDDNNDHGDGDDDVMTMMMMRLMLLTMLVMMLTLMMMLPMGYTVVFSTYDESKACLFYKSSCKSGPNYGVLHRCRSCDYSAQP